MLKKYRLFITLLCAIICALYISTGITSVYSEEEYDLGFYLPDDCVMLHCEASEDIWYTQDPELLEIMSTLEDYYIDQTERERYVLSGDVILMCNPFVFQIDQADDEKTVYCVARIDEYGMYQDKELVKHISLGKSSFSCYKIEYVMKDGRQEVKSIYQPQKDEEFIPGYGCGTQGNNGITDQMIMIMDENDYSASTEEFAEIYLQKNGIMNCILHVDM